jgi:hypothetical protein
MACSACGADSGHLMGCEFSTFELRPTTPPPAVEDLALDTTRPRALSVPIALAVSALLAFTDLGSMVLRILFGMWLHELGHAVASWTCGVFAVPLPWITFSGDARSIPFIVLLVAGLGALGFWAKQQEDGRWLALPVTLGALLLIGLLLPFRHVRTFILFSGDGGAMVFGTLLMLGTVLLPDASRAAKGALRWGYVVIGAGAFMDAFVPWVKASRDWAELPFGRNEGAGLSDALRLVEQSHWSELFLVRSYLVLGAACLVVLAIAVAWRLTSSGSAARTLRGR